MEAEFLSGLSSRINQAIQYEDPILLTQAKSLIPLDELRRKAGEKVPKTLTGQDAQNAMMDFLILELLQWFKHDFFSWVNAPDCELCSAKTESKGSVEPTPEELSHGGSRVESYFCPSCFHVTRFPRYNDPAKLLETRRGRCGEWANCFTLCARAAGFDVRYVLDTTDHVWTEIYSQRQRRWLHCDSCEAACDSPLVYESGWKKQLSHVVAFGRDHVADVAWRYSRRHRPMIARRQSKCREAALAAWIERVNSRLMATCDEARRCELKRREVDELVEFMFKNLKKVSLDEQQGRSSGSVEWRQQRGEMGHCSEDAAGIAIMPDKGEMLTGALELLYTSHSDSYSRPKSQDPEKSIATFASLLHKSDNIMRKLENDWRQVYLCRKDGRKPGSLVWRFELEDANFCFTTLKLNVGWKTFETGKIRALLCTEETCCPLKGNCDEEVNLNMAKSVELKIDLLGGTGNNGWQHSQVFRAPFDCKEPSMKIELKIERKS